MCINLIAVYMGGIRYSKRPNFHSIKTLKPIENVNVLYAVWKNWLGTTSFKIYCVKVWKMPVVSVGNPYFKYEKHMLF